MLLPFVRGSRRDDSSIASHSARLVNFYAEPVAQGGRASAILRPAFGAVQHADLSGVFVRAMDEYDGYVYSVQPGAMYRTDALGAVRIATVANGDTADLSRNIGAVTACIGGNYYVWDTATTTISSPSTGPVTGVAWVEYLAGRTIIGEVGTGKFAWSDIADPATFDGLNFATAEAREDAIIRGMVNGNNLYLFGGKTTEIWYPAGSGAGAFASTGSVIDRGLKAFGLACVADGSLFFVGEDNVAYLMVGNQAAPVSDAKVTAALIGSEARACLYWEERGHKFCAITFADRPAWVFDMATRDWWERAEGPGLLPWRAMSSARLNDVWYIGGTDGRIYTLQDVATDAGQEHYREATSFNLGDGGSWFTIAEAEVMTGAGFETATMQMQVGNGVTFGRPQMMALPAVGDFDGQTVFRMLGRHKRAVLRLSMTGAAVPVYADMRVRLT